ncbi:hypothetical protein U1Q18_017741 [Sarracenia purpurea var. burkii]
MSELSTLNSRIEKLEVASSKIFGGDRLRIRKIAELKETVRVTEAAKICAVSEYERIKDAVGTDNLMQRLKFGSKLKDTKFLKGDEEEDDEDEEDEEFGNEAMEDHVKTSMAQINSRKAKQMIPDMFLDKNDGYLSSDGEERERRLVYLLNAL